MLDQRCSQESGGAIRILLFMPHICYCLLSSHNPLHKHKLCGKCIRIRPEANAGNRSFASITGKGRQVNLGTIEQILIVHFGIKPLFKASHFLSIDKRTIRNNKFVFNNEQKHNKHFFTLGHVLRIVILAKFLTQSCVSIMLVIFLLRDDI